ncbi:MAG: hypothetical protein MZV70_45670 [Desulfobacterales bacterium]|nr:hypothetical protein [Desulfobacterales bacterium]
MPLGSMARARSLTRRKSGLKAPDDKTVVLSLDNPAPQAFFVMLNSFQTLTAAQAVAARSSARSSSRPETRSAAAPMCWRRMRRNPT